jgi:D-arabinose 1-dehydrogenase-like Zn-dependent alcohol dehydrogenase
MGSTSAQSERRTSAWAKTRGGKGTLSDADGFGIDNLRMETREPGANEARVRIEWVSLNRRDLLLVEGVYNPRQSLRVVPCSDGAGTVEAVGSGPVLNRRQSQSEHSGRK